MASTPTSVCSFEHVAAGARNTCVATAHGIVFCWGYPGVDTKPIEHVVGRAGVRRLELGGSLRELKIAGSTMVALRTDGVLQRWYGLRGNVHPIANAVATMALTSDMLCVQQDDGRVLCGALDAGGPFAATREIVEARGAIALLNAGDRLCTHSTSGLIGCWGRSTPFMPLANDVPKDVRSISIDRDGRLLVVNGAGRVSIHGQPPWTMNGRLPPMVEVVAADADRLCGRDDAGAVVCWRLGGVLKARRAPLRPLPVGRALYGDGSSVLDLPAPTRSLVVGDEHVCSLGTDGEVWCWGSNEYGQIGDGGFGATLTPARVDGAPEVIRELAIGRTATCVLDDHGGLSCWGGDYVWPRPQEIHSAPPLRLLTANEETICGIALDGSLLCGRFVHGEATLHWGPPLLLSGTLNPERIAGGRGWTCAAGHGRLGCWEVLTNEQDAPQWGREQIARESVSLHQLTGSRDLLYGIDEAGRALSWEVNKDMGIPSLNEVWFDPEWTNVDEIEWGMCRRQGEHVRCRAGIQEPPPNSRLVGSSLGYVTTSDGLGLERRPRYWDKDRIDEETEIPGRFSAIAGGWGHACGIRDDRRVVCWGANSFGQLGDGGADESWPPSAITSIPDPVMKIWVENSTSCALTAGPKGALWCWGDNEHGQVGDGRSGQYLRPRQFRVPDCDAHPPANSP